MSAENVEIAKRGIGAFNRRDVDLVTELTTGDIEWFTATDGAVEGPLSASECSERNRLIVT
jgi:hypothetical protein